MIARFRRNDRLDTLVAAWHEAIIDRGLHLAAITVAVVAASFSFAPWPWPTAPSWRCPLAFTFWGCSQHLFALPRRRDEARTTGPH
jgi:hypothetical protein